MKDNPQQVYNDLVRFICNVIYLAKKPTFPKLTIEEIKEKDVKAVAAYQNDPNFHSSVDIVVARILEIVLK